MLTLVTGANSKYFNFLILILNNVIEVSNSKNIQISIIVYKLGMNESEIKEKVISICNFRNFCF